jgi:hypothetical protein
MTTTSTQPFRKQMKEALAKSRRDFATGVGVAWRTSPVLLAITIVGYLALAVTSASQDWILRQELNLVGPAAVLVWAVLTLAVTVKRWRGDDRSPTCEARWTATPQPQHDPNNGLIVGEPGSGKTSAASLYRIPRTWRLRRALRAAGGLAAQVAFAWVKACISLIWHFIFLAVGIWIGLTAAAEGDEPAIHRPHPMRWSLGVLWDARPPLLTLWAVAGVFLAAYNWATGRRPSDENDPQGGAA